jgi:hypothetical protein
LRRAFAPSITNRIPCSTSRPRSTQIAEQRGGDGRVLGRALPQPERDLHPVGGDPQRDHVRAALQIDPVDHHHRQAHVVQPARHERVEVLAGAGDELATDGRLARRARRLLDLGTDRLARALQATRGDAGEHLLEHQPRQRVTVGEVAVGLKRHLLAAVDGAHARTLHRHPAPAQRDLAGLVAMADSGALRVVPSPRPDNLGDFFLHQLGHHTESDTDAERQQPLLRGAHKLTQRLLHTRGQHGLLRGRDLRDRYGLLQRRFLLRS